MMKLMMRVTVTITVTVTIFQCGFPRRGRGLEELDAGPRCQSPKAKWSFCHSRHCRHDCHCNHCHLCHHCHSLHHNCHCNHCHVFEVINSSGKGDFLAVFNRDVSSDKTLRTTFQKQYVLMCMNDANQDYLALPFDS